MPPAVVQELTRTCRLKHGGLGAEVVFKQTKQNHSTPQTDTPHNPQTPLVSTVPIIKIYAAD